MIVCLIVKLMGFQWAADGFRQHSHLCGDAMLREYDSSIYYRVVAVNKRFDNVEKYIFYSQLCIRSSLIFELQKHSKSFILTMTRYNQFY